MYFACDNVTGHGVVVGSLSTFSEETQSEFLITPADMIIFLISLPTLMQILGQVLYCI